VPHEERRRLAVAKDDDGPQWGETWVFEDALQHVIPLHLIEGILEVDLCPAKLLVRVGTEGLGCMQNLLGAARDTDAILVGTHSLKQVGRVAFHDPHLGQLEEGLFAGHWTDRQSARDPFIQRCEVAGSEILSGLGRQRVVDQILTKKGHPPKHSWVAARNKQHFAGPTAGARSSTSGHPLTNEGKELLVGLH
jgi:hypothetical protein